MGASAFVCAIHSARACVHQKAAHLKYVIAAVAQLTVNYSVLENYNNICVHLTHDHQTVGMCAALCCCCCCRDGRPQLAPDEVPLQRACGCAGDQECEECEGIRVTMCSSSSFPLVTTPGPKPKLLTLEDLGLPGECFAVLHLLCCNCIC
jgi:hypothetical protein